MTRRTHGWIHRVCIAIALLAPTVASGGTIYWNMNDLTTPTSNAVGNLTVSAVSQGNTTTTGGTTTSVSSGYTFILNSATTTASGSFNLIFSAKSGALDTGSSSYLAVTLTPAAGYSGTVNTIGFGSRSTATGPTTLSLRSSADGYAADVASFSPSTTSNWAYFTNSFVNPVQFSSSSPLTLRLYGSGGSSASLGNWRIDDLQLDVVVVPEPAAVVLGLLAVAGVTIRMRRSGRWRRKRVTECGDHQPVLRSSNCSS
jgi:hypothetical protein